MRDFQRRAELAKRSPAEFLRLVALGEIDPKGDALKEPVSA
jgi:hypothetical protein